MSKEDGPAEMIISKSRTKAAVKECNISSDFYEALDAKVRELIAAAERTRPQATPAIAPPRRALVATGSQVHRNRPANAGARSKRGYRSVLAGFSQRIWRKRATAAHRTPGQALRQSVVAMTSAPCVHSRW